jgi:hypothetical protein
MTINLYKGFENRAWEPDDSVLAQQRFLYALTRDGYAYLPNGVMVALVEVGAIYDDGKTARIS